MADITAKTVRDVLVTQARRKSKLITDYAAIYGHGQRVFLARHSKQRRRRVRSRQGHTNTVESFFANIKCQIYRQHDAVSEQHLQRYVNEAAFK